MDKLDFNIRNSESLISFKGNILKFKRPSKNTVTSLTRLRLGLSHLREDTSDTLLIQFVTAVRTLKPQAITFITVHYIPMND